MVRPRMRSAVLILALLLAVAGTGLSQQSVNRIVGEGIEALKAGEFVRAQQIFAQLVKDAPSAENLGYLAMAEAGAGNLAQAIGHFQRSIRLGNNSASVHYNLGMACLQAGRREEGIRELRTALAWDGKFLPARYPLGIALLEEGRAREALPYLTEATKASPQRLAQTSTRWGDAFAPLPYGSNEGVSPAGGRLGQPAARTVRSGGPPGCAPDDRAGHAGRPQRSAPGRRSGKSLPEARRTPQDSFLAGRGERGESARGECGLAAGASEFANRGTEGGARRTGKRAA